MLMHLGAFHYISFARKLAWDKLGRTLLHHLRYEIDIDPKDLVPLRLNSLITDVFDNKGRRHFRWELQDLYMHKMFNVFEQCAQRYVHEDVLMYLK